MAVAVSSQQGEMRRIEKFARNEQGVSEITKKSLTDKEESSSYLHSRKRIIDDTSSGKVLRLPISIFAFPLTPRMNKLRLPCRN